MLKILTQPLPHFLYRRSGQTTFIVFVALFSLIFINAYKPFSSFEWIPYIRYRGSNAAYLLISAGLVAAGLLVLVLSRIIMTPENAKRLLYALQDNIRKYENTNGEIRLRRGNDPVFPIDLGAGGQA